MKYIKHFLIFTLFVLCIVLSQNAFAQETGTLNITFSKSTIPTITEGDCVMNIYSADSTVLFDTKTVAIKRGYDEFKVSFTVPFFENGDKFKFTLSGNATGAEYGGVTACEHIVQAYNVFDENQVAYTYADFWMTLSHDWNKEAVIKIPGVNQTRFYHHFIDDEVYVSTDLLTALGINVTTYFDSEKPNFVLTNDDSSYRAQFYINDIYATFNWMGENLEKPIFTIDSMPYVPLTRIAEFFKCNYRLEEDSQYAKIINLTFTEYSARFRNASYVNSIDINSKTDYLVWVDKSEYTVNVYLGSNKNWRLIESFPCAIGAPGTPTIEGSFEYFQRQDRWQYDGYYCGPIMRFKGGYALHSVLIRNNGKLYDGRVGVKISHGCVRMLPDDINWMVSYIPMYTRILVTA